MVGMKRLDEVRAHIKPKADSTLLNMKKADLVEYIRSLEHNYNVAVSFNENQAKYIESLDMVNVVRCECCRHGIMLQHSDNVMCYGRKMPKNGFCSYGERKSNGLSVR